MTRPGHSVGADGDTEGDAHLRTYTLTDKELAVLKRFRRHRCFPNPHITVAFTGTSIGTAVKVSCHCGRVEDITDYASW